MPLTKKEKRLITSPLSFSSKQRKATKHRTKIKIQEILCDVKFLIENYSKIYEEFEIDVFENTVISDHFSESSIIENSQDTTHKDTPSSDPDLL